MYLDIQLIITIKKLEKVRNAKHIYLHAVAEKIKKLGYDIDSSYIDDVLNCLK